MGYNLFMSCLNNPINLTDSSGNWPKWVKNAANWVYNTIVKPVTKVVNKVLSKFNAATFIGASFSVTSAGVSYNYQIELLWIQEAMLRFNDHILGVRLHLLVRLQQFIEHEPMRQQFMIWKVQHIKSVDLRDSL